MPLKYIYNDSDFYQQTMIKDFYNLDLSSNLVIPYSTLAIRINFDNITSNEEFNNCIDFLPEDLQTIEINSRDEPEHLEYLKNLKRNLNLLPKSLKNLYIKVNFDYYYFPFDKIIKKLKKNNLQVYYNYNCNPYYIKFNYWYLKIISTLSGSGGGLINEADDKDD